MMARRAVAEAIPRHSRVGQTLFQWGRVSHWVGLIAGALCLLASGAFAGLVHEPLWQRLLTLLIFGVAPAIALFSVGRLIFYILRAGAAICDFVGGHGRC